MSKKFTDVIKKSIRLYSAALAPSKYKLVGQEKNYYRTRWNKGATSIPLYLAYKTLLREDNTQALRDLLNGPAKEPSDDNGNARDLFVENRDTILNSMHKIHEVVPTVHTEDQHEVACPNSMIETLQSFVSPTATQEKKKKSPQEVYDLKDIRSHPLFIHAKGTGVEVDDGVREYFDVGKAKKPEEEENMPASYKTSTHIKVADYKLTRLEDEIGGDRGSITERTDVTLQELLKEADVHALGGRIPDSFLLGGHFEQLVEPGTDRREYVHNHVAVNTKFKIGSHTILNSRKTYSDFLDLLSVITGFTGKDLDSLYATENGERPGLRHDLIFRSPNVRLLWMEAHRMDMEGKGQVTPSPTLFYILHTFVVASKQSRIQRYRHKSNVTGLLVLLLLEYLRDHIRTKKDADDAPARVRMACRHVNVIMEATMSRNTQYKSSTYLDKFLKHIRRSRGKKLDDKMSARSHYVDLFPSIERQEQKIEQQKDVRKMANLHPVVLDIPDLLAFKDQCITDIEKEGGDSWKAAMALVELCTGARFAEIIVYAGFYTYRQLDSDTREQYEKYIQETRRMYPDMSYQNAIIQYGVLKGRGDRAMGLRRWLLPKPVILGVEADNIVRYVYVAIREHLAALLVEQNKIQTITDYYSISHKDFAYYNTQVNQYINKTYKFRNGDTRRLTTHNLRKVYANWSFDEYGISKMSRNAWISGVLGHEEDSLTASLSYTGTRFNKLLKFSEHPSDETKLAQDLMDHLSPRFTAIEEKLQWCLTQLQKGATIEPSSSVLGKRRRDTTTVLRARSTDNPSKDMDVVVRRHDHVKRATAREKADEVADYVQQHFSIWDDDGRVTHRIPNTTTNLRAVGFGHEYTKAYRELG
jgi:hypothetical protein